jgi:hypothetical protein
MAGEQVEDYRAERAHRRIEAAEEFVRSVFRLMGRDADAEDVWLVRAAALRALEALPALDEAEAKARSKRDDDR